MMTTPSTLLLAASLLSVHVTAGGEAEPVDSPRLVLVSAGSEVDLEGEVAARLTTALTSYFASCHSYETVVFGEEPPQDELRRLWAEHKLRTHALLHMTGGADSRHAGLRGRRFSLLLGLESESGPLPVLTEDENRHLTAYIKCPGLEGLILACQIHGIIPGMTPSPDCGRWNESDRGGSAASTDQR